MSLCSLQTLPQETVQVFLRATDALLRGHTPHATVVIYVCLMGLLALACRA